MHDAIASPLKAWESFYLIVGTAAGALTGLQFVVMALIAEAEAARRKDSISAFGSPNIVHFCAALLATSILSAPWAVLRHAGVAISGCGLLGMVYSAVVMRRALRQGGYEPVVEDWVWHTLLPMLSYSALLAAGAMLGSHSAEPLFVIGAALLMLLFIGIHNAWDTVVYVTVEQPDRRRSADTGPVGEIRGSSPSAPPSSGSGGDRDRGSSPSD